MSAPIPTPIPIALVGLGFGRWILRGLQEPEMKKLFTVAALCDLDRSKAEELSAEVGGCRIATLEELLADPSVPVIGLFTPPVGRAKLLQRIIRAGKHVMTTKPFEHDSELVAPLFEEAARLGRVIHLNSPAPTLPADLALVRDWQEKHALGQPIAAQISTWVRYYEKPSGTWLDDPKLCPVAPIYRLGIYLINDLAEIFGAADEVQVASSRLFTERPTADHAILTIKFKSGALASIFASFCVNDAACYRNSMILNFENGTVYRAIGPVGTNLNKPMSLVVAKGEKSEIPTTVEETMLSGDLSGQYQWQVFHDAVLAGKVATPEYAANIANGLRIIEAMAESEQEGRPVKVK